MNGKRVLYILGILLFLGAASYGSLIILHRINNDSQTAAPSPTPGTSNSQTPGPSPQPAAFNKTKFPLGTAGSLWWVVNKTRPLNPSTYAPGDLAVPAMPLRQAGTSAEMNVSAKIIPAMEQMSAAAKQAGAPLMLASGYRSYQTQVSVYGSEVKQYGQTVADSESARPSYSEHQTGLAADLEPASRECEINDCFATTPAGVWLAANAYKYGFIIRYAKDKQAVTGYRYEPWHVRYVGAELAAEMHRTKTLTLEEFFGLPAAPNYLD